MRTEELIRAMAADTERSRPVEELLPVAIGATAAAAALIFYFFVDTRPDFGSAIGHLDVAMKQTLPLVVAFAALGAVFRLARPGRRLGGWAFALLAAPLLAAVAFVERAIEMPVSTWGDEITGSTLAFCLTFVPLIGLPILAGTLWVLRRGASTRPALSGAAAGLLSGSVSAAVYAFNCPDDSPMFWGVWYVLAILIVTGLGACIGARVLRW